MTLVISGMAAERLGQREVSCWWFWLAVEIQRKVNRELSCNPNTLFLLFVCAVCDMILCRWDRAHESLVESSTQGSELRFPLSVLLCRVNSFILPPSARSVPVSCFLWGESINSIILTFGKYCQAVHFDFLEKCVVTLTTKETHFLSRSHPSPMVYF